VIVEIPVIERQEGVPVTHSVAASEPVERLEVARPVATSAQGGQLTLE
jgi:hypothetical protein